MEDLQLHFHSPTPGILGPFSSALPLWCPVEDSTGDVVLSPSCVVCDPSPSRLHDDIHYALLAASGAIFIIGDCLRSE